MSDDWWKVTETLRSSVSWEGEKSEETERGRGGGSVYLPPVVPSTLQPHLYLSPKLPLSDSCTCLRFFFTGLCTAVLNHLPPYTTHTVLLCTAVVNCNSFWCNTHNSSLQMTDWRTMAIAMGNNGTCTHVPQNQLFKLTLQTTKDHYVIFKNTAPT
jgi:hypothetical protein